jgi:uroporphyrinogen-III synthase
MASVFISRSDEYYPTLKFHLAEGSHTFIAQSLIEINFLKFTLPENVDWVFFTSRNAVESFFSQHAGQKYHYAALGSGTAMSLSKHASVDFTGDEKEIQESAKKFQLLLADKRVLFPSSTISVRSFQNELPENQVMEVEAYGTKLSPQEIPACDIYVFSSPSNVESFALRNSFPKGVVVLVPGQKTKTIAEKYYKGNIIDVRSLADSTLTGTIFSDILS